MLDNGVERSEFEIVPQPPSGALFNRKGPPIMATPHQIAANKANAQKSTGPKTPEGKAKSAGNRLSSGFASNTIVIPGEDPNEFRGLVEDFIAEHQPVTVTEQVLVEKMAQQQWLSLRAFRLQGEAFISQAEADTNFGVPKDLGLLIRYQTSADRAFHRAHNELVKAKKQRTNSEIGFESQNLEQGVHAAPQEPAPAPPEPPKAAPVVPISSNSPSERPRPTFTAEEMDFPLCHEAIEFFKKRA